MILNLSGEINQDSLNKLIDTLNESEDQRIIIYLSSTGGDAGAAGAMVHLISLNKNRIQIIGYDDLFSAGFFIFFKSDCEKILLKGTLGMYHLTCLEFNEAEINLKDSQYKASKEYLTKEKPKTKIFCEEVGMTKGEINKILKGEDVYFQPDRMIEMLNYKEING